MQDLNIYEEERPWGNFRRFTLNAPSTVKLLTINPNESFSMQSHQKRDEFWRVVSGDGTVEIDGATYEANKGKEYTVRAGNKHRVNAGAYGISILEIATGDFDEDDIVRFEDKYGRV